MSGETKINTIFLTHTTPVLAQCFVNLIDLWLQIRQSNQLIKIEFPILPAKRCELRYNVDSCSVATWKMNSEFLKTLKPCPSTEAHVAQHLHRWLQRTWNTTCAKLTSTSPSSSSSLFFVIFRNSIYRLKSYLQERVDEGAMCIHVASLHCRHNFQVRMYHILFNTCVKTPIQ